MLRASEWRTRTATISFLTMLAVILISGTALAQSDNNPKWDLFAGYQYFHPGGNVPAAFGNPNSPTPFKVPDMTKGFGMALTYNFTQLVGGEVDLGQNWGYNNYTTTVSVGPRLMWRTEGANYFVHGLIGLNRLGVSGLNSSDGFGAIAGGGMDLPIRKWVSFRLFEADYVWSRHNYSAYAVPYFSTLYHPNLSGVRLRSGFDFSWGGAPEVTPAASCSVQPTEVMVGEPLTATVNASNFNPKHTLKYAWTGNGGQVSGSNTTARIDTTNATPGSYTVSAHVTDPKEKKNNEASCTANYTIKPLPPKNPPTISCSANPSTVQAGQTATITCNASSPDSVAVNVSNWTSSAGSINGSGETASLNTTGMQPGTVTVGATATDSRGLTAQGSTQLTIENPPPPPPNPEIVALEQRLALHSVYFPTNQPPVSKPDAGLVASQQKTLLTMATDFGAYLKSKPDAQLILQGHADMRGSSAFNQALSQRRVASVKNFLVKNGVPETAIQTEAFGKDHNLTRQEVEDSIDRNPELTQEERARALRNIAVLQLASNRRVDIVLKTGEKSERSVRQYPFNAADSLTLIGGRESERKAAAAKRAAAARKHAPKKKQ